ncbi:MAG: cellulose binding domain-containing protein, partial [Pricia sp.]
VQEGTFDGFDEKKEGWYVWQAAGTPDEDVVFEPYKSVIGISDWSEIYNEVTTETTPFSVQMNIANCGADLQDLVVSFNGELKIPQEDGSLDFFNVASNVDHAYEISKNGALLAAGSVVVSQDLILEIDLQAIDNISATGISPSEVEVQWQSAMMENSGYVLEFKTADGTFEELARLASDELSYSHTGLVSGELYSYRVAAIFNEDSQSCYSEEVEVFAPFVIVDYKNGDRNRPGNNQIKPQLMLRNEADSDIDLARISVRYWFTAENFDPLNLYVDYAALGNQNISGSFVALEQPREGANYYAELSFANGASISALGNSGIIKTRISKSDFSDFDESNDHSYTNSNSFSETDKITVYWDGALIWGEEPSILTDQNVQLSVLHNNRDNPNNNSIKPYLQLINSGNIPVDLNDVTLRYWFTPEGTAALNYKVDYAEIREDVITGRFETQGSDTYLEIGFTDTAGILYAYSGTGEIKSRVYKQDWSSFNENDDYSFKAIDNTYAETSTVTAYINGELVWGIEPSTSLTAVRKSAETFDVTVYPNPAVETLQIKWNEEISSLGNFMLLDYRAVAHPIKEVSTSGEDLTMRLENLTEGIYLLKGEINGQEVSHRIVVE